jgi:hypothetical protein
MLPATTYRKLKEVEEKKLKNRLNLLKLELAKSKKKIDETRKRTKDILEHREEIMRKHQRKVQESLEREKEQRRIMELNAAARERMTNLRRANVLSVQLAKAEDAKQIYEESRRNEEQIARQRELEQRRAEEVKKLIREQRMAGQGAREAELQRKRDEARAEFQKRLEYEASLSAACENNVSEMEKMELELIAQIEKAQMVQRKAYQELEDALINSKRTIMETSREKLQKSIVDSGAVRRSPKHSSRQNRSQPPHNATDVDETAPREAVAAN